MVAFRVFVTLCGVISMVLHPLHNTGTRIGMTMTSVLILVLNYQAENNQLGKVNYLIWYDCTAAATITLASLSTSQRLIDPSSRPRGARQTLTCSRSRCCSSASARRSTATRCA